MILFECPGMIGPLDTATLARCRIIPFFGRERYDSWISEQIFFAYGQGLTGCATQIFVFYEERKPKNAI